MKTYAHGEQDFWAVHHPTYKEWRSLLRRGDGVKIQKYGRNPSLVIYTFDRLIKGPHPTLAKLSWMGLDCWCYVINSKGNEMVVLTHTLVPTNRVKRPKEQE